MKKGKEALSMQKHAHGTEVSDILPENYELNLSDFALFLSVMQKKEAYECTLSIIMDEKDLRLKEVKVEQVVLNRLGKRAIRLDAWALDLNDCQFNMEMQNDTQGDDVRKRSRYYQGLLDSPVLKAGKNTKYRQLPSTVIIFITQEDIFGKDRAMYTFTEQCEEEGLKLEDGTKKIFLNMKSKNGRPELISLLQYMKNTQMDNPEMPVKDSRIKKLDKIVREVKQSEEWEAVKMSILEIGLKKGEELGIERGLERGLEQGLERGLEQGLEQGIEAFILDKVEDHVDKMTIKNKLIKRFQLSEEQAEAYYSKYASQIP